MTQETEQLDYTDAVVNFMIRINQQTSRSIALDLWKYYPEQTQLLTAALIQTQHTKQIPRLFTKD